MLNFKIRVSYDAVFQDGHGIQIVDADSLRSIPNVPGVYMLHHGPLTPDWKNEKLFYVGQTYGSGLRSRAIVHRFKLLGFNAVGAVPTADWKANAMSKYGYTIKNRIDDIWFSYCVVGKEFHRSLPFVIECSILDEYRAATGSLPAANKGSR